MEFLHNNQKHKAKTLFATHYHELNQLTNDFPRIKNFNVSVKEAGDQIIFLRKLKEGGSEHSFGIHVARMAGMPKSLISRANEVLEELEGDQDAQKLSRPVSVLAEKREGYQLSIFQLDDPVLKQIRDEIELTDIDKLTPLEALNKLNEIKKMTGLE